MIRTINHDVNIGEENSADECDALDAIMTNNYCFSQKMGSTTYTQLTPKAIMSAYNDLAPPEV